MGAGIDGTHAKVGKDMVFTVHFDGRLTMSSQIGDTTNSIALDFDVRAEHLSNKRLQAAQFDDEKLVISWISVRLRCA